MLRGVQVQRAMQREQSLGYLQKVDCLQLGGEDAAAGCGMVLLNKGVLQMNLCEICGEGKLEMCQYFKEHYLESGAAVKDCPKFRPDEEQQEVQIMRPIRADSVRIMSSRSVRKALAGARVMLLTACKAEQGSRLIRAIAESNMKNRVASVHICFHGGGEIWIGGVDHVDQ